MGDMPDEVDRVYQDFNLDDYLDEKGMTFGEGYAQYKRAQTQELVTLIKENRKETKMTNKLYETVNEKKREYGSFLAYNSAGQIILEMAGTKEVKAFNKDEVQKVLPYTVSVKFVLASSGNQTKAYEYLASKNDDLKVGDIIWLDGYDQFVRIDAVDTKSEKATAWLKGNKLLNVPLTVENSD